MTQNPDNLPVVEETSLHNIVLRVRDWQETIDKKFVKTSFFHTPLTAK